MLPPSQSLPFLTNTQQLEGGAGFTYLAGPHLRAKSDPGRGEALALRERGMRSRRGRSRGRISPLLQLQSPSLSFTALGCLLLLGQKVTEGTGPWAGLRPTESTGESTGGAAGHARDLLWVPCHQECFSIRLVSAPPPPLERLFPTEVCSRGGQPGRRGGTGGRLNTNPRQGPEVLKCPAPPTLVLTPPSLSLCNACLSARHTGAR